MEEAEGVSTGEVGCIFNSINTVGKKGLSAMVPEIRNHVILACGIGSHSADTSSLVTIIIAGLPIFSRVNLWFVVPIG